MDGLKEPIVEPLDGAVSGRDVEAPAGAYGHAPDIDALLRAGCDDGAHHIAGLEALHHPRPLRAGAREAKGVHPAHLAYAVAHRPNQQRTYAAHAQRLGRAGADASRIVPVGLRQPQAGAVELRAPASADLDRQAGGHQPPIERPTCLVDRRGVLEWAAGLCLDVGVTKLRSGLRAFPGITRFTRQGEVMDTVGAAPRLRDDMLDLKSDILRAAVGAAAAPLFQHIFAYLVARQRALLVRHTADLGVLHELRVKPHQLGADSGERHEPLEPADPGERRSDPVLEAGRQPAPGPAPVQEARLAVAGLALPPTAADRPPAEQGVADRLPPVGQLARPDNAPGRLGHHRDAGGLGTRVEFQPVRVGGARGGAAPREPDGEGVAPPHGSLPVVEQLPRPRRVARVERLAVAAEDKDVGHGLDYSSSRFRGKVRLDNAPRACRAGDLPPLPQAGVIAGDRATGWQRTGRCRDPLCVAREG